MFDSLGERPTATQALLTLAPVVAFIVAAVLLGNLLLIDGRYGRGIGPRAKAIHFNENGRAQCTLDSPLQRLPGAGTTFTAAADTHSRGSGEEATDAEPPETNRAATDPLPVVAPPDYDCATECG